MPQHRLKELNRKHNFLHKLGYTVLLLVFGAVVTPLFWIGVELTEEPVLRWMLSLLIDALIPFYFLLLVFLWWRPAWLSRFYDRAEAKLVRLGYLFSAIVFGLLLIMLGYAVIAAVFF